MFILKTLKRICGEVRNKPLTIALCYPENNFSYTIPHLGKYDKNTIGKVCGVKEYWIDIVDEITYDNINSLQAGEMVLNYLIDKNNGNLFEALKDFKGAKTNLTSVYKTLEIYKRLNSK